MERNNATPSRVKRDRSAGMPTPVNKKPKGDGTSAETAIEL